MNQTAYMGPIEAKQYNAARERKARLYGLKVAPKLQIASSVIPVTSWADRPMWKRFETRFNEHEAAWKLFLLNKAMSPVNSYLWVRCNELKVKWDDIRGRSVDRALVAKRHQLMWDVRQTFPEMSLPQIGRFFSRDHTVIIYAIQKIEGQRIRAGVT